MTRIEELAHAVTRRGEKQAKLSPEEVEALEALGFSVKVLQEASDIHGKRSCKITKAKP